jgi:hypothetical protein
LGVKKKKGGPRLGNFSQFFRGPPQIKKKKKVLPGGRIISFQKI